MTAPKPRPPIRPRLMNAGETASYLGMSPNRFSTLRSKLGAMGFPAAVPFAEKLWDRVAIDHWLDALGGLAPRYTGERERLSEAIEAWAP